MKKDKMEYWTKRLEKVAKLADEAHQDRLKKHKQYLSELKDRYKNWPAAMDLIEEIENLSNINWDNYVKE